MRTYEESSPVSNSFSPSTAALSSNQNINNKSRNSLTPDTDNNATNRHSANNNNSRPTKFKPEPLIIPSTISSFQQHQTTGFNFYNNPLLMHSHSMNELYNSHKLLSSVYAHMIYPNTTFLKSPRLVNYDLKKQYTPPPMLSPFRKGPGLFCNSKQFSR